MEVNRTELCAIHEEKTRAGRRADKVDRNLGQMAKDEIITVGRRSTRTQHRGSGEGVRDTTSERRDIIDRKAQI